MGFMNNAGQTPKNHDISSKIKTDKKEVIDIIRKKILRKNDAADSTGHVGTSTTGPVIQSSYVPDISISIVPVSEKKIVY